MKNKINLIIIGLALLCIFPACKRTSDFRPDAVDPIKNMKDGPITLKSGVVIIKKGNNYY
ncbi:hypothetical protein LX99_02838 [Mucilaginibacter oryzae]|uniref:Uncharacterized protein n=1 Tax=Mucilaginibacter oryzae TaxID=468058 RepID=A0A316HD60_9SPHI|nr:hypothetical protein LX99_02838 [Mucilaginibacter oryzae]